MTTRIGYRIRHKDSGLFFSKKRNTLNKDGYYVYSNLSEKGRMYTMHPSLDWAAGHTWTHLLGGEESVQIKTTTDDWEVVSPGQIPPPIPKNVDSNEWILQIAENAAVDADVDLKVKDHDLLKKLVRIAVNAAINAQKEFRLNGAL